LNRNEVSTPGLGACSGLWDVATSTETNVIQVVEFVK
jgi:hypothetical protein